MDYLVAPERLDADGFTLRSYLPGDGPRFFDAVDTSREHIRPWASWADNHATVDDAEQYARVCRGKWLKCEDFTLAIVSPDGDRILGGCGLHLRDGGIGKRQAEIGMFIRASEAGTGLGTRALVALLGWGFDAWPFERLMWRCEVANVASRRVAEKAGMPFEGVQRNVSFGGDDRRRDMNVFAALRGEWTAPSGE